MDIFVDNYDKYTFIPTQEVRLVLNEEEDSIANRAKINNIKDSWRVGVDYSNLLRKATSINTAEKTKQQDFEFIINNDYTYHHFSDFKSFSARELFIKAIEVERKLEEAKKELSIIRAQYAAAASINQSSLATEILLMEKTVGELYDQWRVGKVMARNEEIRHINPPK